MQIIQKRNLLKKLDKNLDDKGRGRAEEKPKIVCFRCGKSGHPRSKCALESNVKCFNCNKTGHVARACRRPKSRGFSLRPAESHFVEINGVGNPKVNSHFDKVYATFNIENRDCKMEIDTGSPVSIMSRKTFKKIAPHIKQIESILLLCCTQRTESKY